MFIFVQILFMKSVIIRQKLHNYIDTGDEKLINLMYAMAKEYNEEDDFEYIFSADEILSFEKRRKDRLQGKSKTYNWSQAKAIITGKRK